MPIDLQALELILLWHHPIRCRFTSFTWLIKCHMPYINFSLLPYFAWYCNESKISSMCKIKDCSQFIGVGHDNLYMFCKLPSTWVFCASEHSSWMLQMCGPTCIRILYCKNTLLNAMPPFLRKYLDSTFNPSGFWTHCSTKY